PRRLDCFGNHPRSPSLRPGSSRTIFGCDQIMREIKARSFTNDAASAQRRYSLGDSANSVEVAFTPPVVTPRRPPSFVEGGWDHRPGTCPAHGDRKPTVLLRQCPVQREAPSDRTPRVAVASLPC